MESEQKKEDVASKRISKYHEQVMLALLNPGKSYTSAAQIARDYDNYDNRGHYADAVNDFLETKQIFIDKDGVLTCPFDKNNRWLRASFLIQTQYPTALHDMIRSVEKNAHMRRLFQNTMNTKTKKILEDCKLSMADLETDCNLQPCDKKKDESPDDSEHPVK